MKNKKPRPWGERIKRKYKELLRSHGEPREIAWGMALGVLISLTPTFGVQMVLAVFLAALFKCSKLAALIGVQLTNVLTAPFIYPIVYWAGHKALGLSRVPAIDGANLGSVIELLKSTPWLLADLLAGGLIIGLPAALIAYFITLKVVESYRSKIKPRLSQRRKRKPRKKRK